MSEPANVLPRMSILGLGAVTPLGRDLEVITKALEKSATPQEVCFRVPDELLMDAAISKKMRRADRLTRMAAIAAINAWNMAQSHDADIAMDRVGLIVATGFGPHCRGFQFLDGILDCGDAEALPTDFSHSVHCAAAAYLTELLGLRGPSLTTTAFENGFEQAVQLAQCWLDQSVCDRVLVGAAEEAGDVLIDCASRILGKDRQIIPGEGAVFLTLARSDIAGMAYLNVASAPEKCDLLMLDIPAIPSANRPPASPHAQSLTTFNPYFGHMPCSSAFQLLGGLLSMLANRPLGQIIKIAADTQPASTAVDSAATSKPSFDPHSTSLVLTKR